MKRLLLSLYSTLMMMTVITTLWTLPLLSLLIMIPPVSAVSAPEFLQTFSSADITATSVTTIDDHDDHDDNETWLSSSCADIADCHDCSNTYTCHWCDFDQLCHAKGSIHGCSWGTASCDAPAPTPSDNNNDDDDDDNSNDKPTSACSSHNTCSECTLSSHLCHWCAFDNACHAVGSRHGCVAGVDCYSNDRCRRNSPEPLDPSPIVDVSKLEMILILIVASSLLTCVCCCYFCIFHVKGAYDDLATISMAASRPPSVIGGTYFAAGMTNPNANASTAGFYSTLESHLEESNEDEGSIDHPTNTIDTGLDEEAPEIPADADAEEDADANIGSSKGTQSRTSTQEEKEERPQDLPPNPTNSGLIYSPDTVITNNDNDGDDGDDGHDINYVDTVDDSPNDLSRPLLPTSEQSVAQSFHAVLGVDEPPHMKALYRLCTVLFYLSLIIIISLTAVALVFFPKPPIYNVCNDAVAWKKIIEEFITLKLDASFEILVSVSNPNHLTVVLEKATGSFSFDGQPIGTYEIPAETVQGMSVTDLMLVATVRPDKHQALRLAQAYYRGKLVLNADFHAKLQAPALFNMVYDVDMEDIDVYVNELGPRDLCHCPSWDDLYEYEIPADVLLPLWN